jgi:hypothetical protein
VLLNNALAQTDWQEGTLTETNWREFVRERLGSASVVCGASQIELMPGGVRFHAEGAPRNARLAEGMLVFWTPRLSPWVLSQARKAEVDPQLPAGVRMWEQWSLLSRDVLDPSVIGIYRDMAVWAEVEGPPQSEVGQRMDCLAVLKAGIRVPVDGLTSPALDVGWASAESFGAISALCHQFLKWEWFSVRAMRTRAIFEWDYRNILKLSPAADDEHQVYVVPACDGPLTEVARNARAACERLGTAPGIRTAPRAPATGGEGQ